MLPVLVYPRAVATADEWRALRDRICRGEASARSEATRQLYEAARRDGRYAIPQRWDVDADTVVDLIHEVLSVCWDELLEKDSPRAFFLIAVKRKAIDRFRKQVRHERVVDHEEAGKQTAAPEAEPRVGASAELDQGRADVETRPGPRDLRVFQAAVMLGETSKAIAEAEGLTPANVDQIVSRTRKRLKERFDAGS